MDTKFSVAVHILIMFSETKEKLTSEKIAKSVNTNSSYIRKVIALLKKSNLLLRAEGSFDYSLGKSKDSLTLLEIYRAVQTPKLLYTHQNANRQCPVGAYINKALDPIIEHAEIQLEKDLENQTLEKVIDKIRKELDSENNQSF
ncbi:Rrf2 family transcriptional regulator [Actinomyces sp. zg-332]|uniref:Rrf2 family transcriptional regulator n=1 Tax=Actinomyces sp. zg-332 TaxID=2708340 RepID=UPI00141EC1A2|nr:Rrf2 family transcriptional regulator [Actinomyces sp. zg-332]QPK93602.1 Rrf2 family transcriptional regulator [Actinomyces sp. zg-332]